MRGSYRASSLDLHTGCPFDNTIDTNLDDVAVSRYASRTETKTFEKKNILRINPFMRIISQTIIDPFRSIRNMKYINRNVRRREMIFPE